MPPVVGAHVQVSILTATSQLISGGTLSVAGASTLADLAVSGVSTLTGDVVASVIRRATTDGADNSTLTLMAGAAASSGRGAWVGLYGNENANTGAIDIVAGNVAGGAIYFYTGATALRGKITDGGILAWGTTVVTGAAAGEFVLGTEKALRFVNSAGTTTYSLMRSTAIDLVLVADAAASVFASLGTLAAASLPAGLASRNGLIVTDSTNNRLIYYSGGARYYLTGTAF